jgi:Fic family protein
MNNSVGRWIGVTAAAKQWGVSTRRVRVLCEAGVVQGAEKPQGRWRIPADAPKPADGRHSRNLDIRADFIPLFREADALRDELARRRPLSQAERERLREEFTIEYTHDSNAIEGNTLTLSETALVLQGVTIDRKPLKDHLEVVGYKEAYEYIEQLAREQRELTNHEICAIHSLVLADRKEDRGRWRNVPVNIEGALTTPALPAQIEPMMSALLADMGTLYRQLHIVEKVALFHLRFEGIHPFTDGNGRTGRLLMNLQLLQAGFPPINVTFADRHRYYDAFDDYAKSGSPKAMTSLIANYLEQRLESMTDILNQILISSL